MGPSTNTNIDNAIVSHHNHGKLKKALLTGLQLYMNCESVHHAKKGEHIGHEFAALMMKRGLTADMINFTASGQPRTEEDLQAIYEDFGLLYLNTQTDCKWDINRKADYDFNFVKSEGIESPIVINYNDGKDNGKDNGIGNGGTNEGLGAVI